MRVRIKIKKTLFSKGDIQTVSRDIYEIIEKKGQKNTLKNLNTGEVVKRTFTDEELSQTFEHPEGRSKSRKQERKELVPKELSFSLRTSIAQRKERRVIKRPVWKSM